MNLLTTNDPRIERVREFDRNRMLKVKSSVINDAKKYSREDFNITFSPMEKSFIIKIDDMNETSENTEVKKILKRNESENLVKEVNLSTWQGLVLKERYNDPDLVVNKVFTWLTHWKDCPVSIINEIQNIYLQTIPTLTFKKFRAEKEIDSTICRLCRCKVESVKHLLRNCTFFLNGGYKRRHDKVCLNLHWSLCKKYDIAVADKWYQHKPDAVMENEKVKLLWDFNIQTDREIEHR